MNDTLNKISAVIVSFNPNMDSFSRIIEETIVQVDTIIIVDNGSEVSTVNKLNKIALENSDVCLIKLPVNVGIASAQNSGIKEAFKNRSTHILFLDHDSIPDKCMVKNLLDVEKELLAKGKKVGVIGPTCIDRRTKTASGFVKKKGMFISRIYPEANKGYVETDFLISSGSLSRISVIKDVGYMNDGYFIDHVDTEWCFRAINCGYKLYGSAKALLNHSLGENVTRIWLLRWREIPQHKSFRYYYIFRNTLAMIRNTKMSFSWKVTHIYRLMLFLMFFSIIGNERKSNIKMIYRGIKDNTKNITGGYKD